MDERLLINNISNDNMAKKKTFTRGEMQPVSFIARIAYQEKGFCTIGIYRF